MSIRILYPVFLGLLMGLFPQAAHTQSANLGNPPVLNYSRQKFKAGTQTWEITQDEKGVMWFANNDGLLEFDGIHWRLHPLKNGTIVRSVQAGADGNLYVGGQGDFGMFSPDGQGRMQYHSMKSLLSKSDQKFGDVWDVAARAEGVFYRTNNRVFWLHNGEMTAFFQSVKSLLFMGNWGDKLLVQDGDLILYIFENGQFHPLESPSVFKLGQISSVLPFNADTILVTTIKDGIFFYAGHGFEPWATQNDAYLKANRIYCASMLPDGKIALGTSLNGLVTLDRQRRIYHLLNKKSGLQNNTVLSIFAARNGGVWLGLDNGIDFADLHSAFSTFYPDGDLQGTGYTVQIFNGKIYFGTNTGLYAANWKNYYLPEERTKFTQIQNSGGQVWSLNKLDGQLLMGHHEGAFEIRGYQARQLTKLQGIWKFIQLSPDVAIAGHYNGLAIFHKDAAGWAFESVPTGLTESSRILAMDDQGAVWMAHPYRGIYRILVDREKNKATSEYFNGEQGLPSDLGNHLFKLGGKVVFVGEKGVFDFDYEKHRFVPNDKFNRIFGEDSHVKYLSQDEEGNIWYATDRETGVLMVETDALEKKIRRVPIPELKDKLTGGFPFILPVDRQNVFVATGQGFIHFDPTLYSIKDSALRVVLHDVLLKTEHDSILYGGHVPLAGLEETQLGSRQNSISFSFAAPDYPGGEQVGYAHLLEGLEIKWSEWEKETELTFNNLPPGKYTFRLKARNQHGIQSKELRYGFTIMPPWYASRLAYLFYGLLLLGLVIGIIYRQHQLFEKEKQNLQDLHQHREEQHQIQAKRSEEEINRLQNEKLETEVTHKTWELTSVTMHLVQKNEIMNSIQEALGKLQHKVTNSPELEKEIGRIIKVLEHDSNINEDWERFFHNFDQVHSDFLKRLGEQYAHLSPNDYKMCAYLRMNLSSKEIAALMNLSVRTVEASRYRLRKRLGLDTKINLTEFLMQF
jgi:ligand-binding sensor domain-containing protein/DNA-binding CsgD family transcriptional regulator